METLSKICKKCFTAKPLDEYHKSSRYKSGYLARCKECVNLKSNKWRKNHVKLHPEKYKCTETKLEWQRKDRAANPEKYKAYTKKYYNLYADKLKETYKQWAALNKEALRKSNKQYRKLRVGELHDGYIKFLLNNKNKTNLVDIPQALIEVKRLQILIKRRVKNENSNSITK